MLRLAKYLKPYILQIFLAILFLFVQANADLALPDYMSRIVDNGIQQGGIEDSVPEAIRETMLKKTLIFLSDSEDETILENYTLIDQDSVAYETYLEEYPILADEPVYVLNDIDAETREELNELLSESLMIVYSIQQVIDNPDAAQEMGFGDSEFEMPELEPGTDIFDLLEELPQLQINMITNTFSGQIEVLGQEMATQVSIKVVNAEYDAIGLDMGSLQTSYILAVGLEMLLISLLGGGATISAGYLASRVAAAVARDIRRDLFIKVENFSSAEFNAFSTASLITRSTNDITQVQMVVFMIMRMVLFAPIMGIGSIIRAVNKGGGMTWILAAAVITLLSFVIIVFIVALPKFRIIQSLIDRLNLVTRENLSGMLVIRAFNKQHLKKTVLT